MLINIDGLDRAKVLVALYNNAKQSMATSNVIAQTNRICSDPYILKTQYDLFEKDIDEIRKKLELNEMEANRLLSRSTHIDYISYVLIRISFRSGLIDVRSYDEAHAETANSASQIIEGLKRGYTQTSSLFKPAEPTDNIQLSPLMTRLKKELPDETNADISRLIEEADDLEEALKYLKRMDGISSIKELLDEILPEIRTSERKLNP